MGLLGNVMRGLVRGADCTAAWTSKRGPQSFYKSRGAHFLGYRTCSQKFKLVPEKVPRLVVPDLSGFKLRPYISYQAPVGSEQPLTARTLFQETVASKIEKDVKAGTFNLQAAGEVRLRTDPGRQTLSALPQELCVLGWHCKWKESWCGQRRRRGFHTFIKQQQEQKKEKHTLSIHSLQNISVLKRSKTPKD